MKIIRAQGLMHGYPGLAGPGKFVTPENGHVGNKKSV